MTRIVLVLDDTVPLREISEWAASHNRYVRWMEQERVREVLPGFDADTRIAVLPPMENADG